MPVSYEETKKNQTLTQFVKEKVIKNSKDVWDRIFKLAKKK